MSHVMWIWKDCHIIYTVLQKHTGNDNQGFNNVVITLMLFLLHTKVELKRKSQYLQYVCGN